MLAMLGEKWGGVGSAVASLMFIWVAVRPYLPHQLNHHLVRWSNRLIAHVNPFVYIKFPEYSGERLKRSEAYTTIEAYLSGTCSATARRLTAEVGKDSDKLVLSLDAHEEVPDAFQGATLRWSSGRSSPVRQAPTFFSTQAQEERKYFRLSFHRRHRDLVNGAYLRRVMEEGRAVTARRRQRRLYTNNPNPSPYRGSAWNHVAFEHPATFDTLAMPPEKRRDILQDLYTFRESRDYYKKIGKPWKRGYLLYGPPGTGKSTMVAAMANLLDYDVYDLELTAVADNSALRKLLIETTSKSIMVIEDIDCSLDLTGRRKKGEKKTGEKGEEEKIKAAAMAGGGGREDSKVTLSGLLNFIDGLWSACGSERLIVFTTNHIEKLDPALIRRGRMDKHIELSYCGFEAFEVLARNYLDVDRHPLFERIRWLLEEVEITPADVAENLMPKTRGGGAEEVDACLEGLVAVLEETKSKAAAAAAAEAGAAEDDGSKLREDGDGEKESNQQPQAND